jgi:CRP-like cAMP-binding protein
MNNFWGNIFKDRNKEDEEIISVLKNIPVFEGLNRRELSAIELILHRRDYRPEEVIFQQGDPAVGMYIIIRGDVEIVYESASRVLASLRSGEFFGELALLDDSPRSAKAIARTQSRMLGFFQSDLFDLTERNPKLGVKVVTRLARIIGERLKKSNEQIQIMQEELDALKQGQKV